MDGMSHQSTATIATGAAGNHVRVLLADLEALGEVVEEEPGARVVLTGGGSCRVVPEPKGFRLEAGADDEQTLARVQDAVGGRVESLGDGSLSVVWS
jgi:hypothetical protein